MQPDIVITSDLTTVQQGTSETQGQSIVSNAVAGPTISGNVTTGGRGATGAQGGQGIQGDTGPQGPQGDPGEGVPVGGTAGQVLAKVDGTDYNTEWVASGGGAVDSVNSQTGVVVLDQDDIGDGATYKQYSQTEKTKLAGIETGAEVNNISDANATDLTDAGDSALHFHSSDRNRSNHTGTQTASTISDFDTEVSNNTDVAANTSARHSAVTLAGEDFLSLAGQVITANPIDLDNLSATGTPSGTTFLRGDNTWATPSSGAGDVVGPASATDNNLASFDFATGKLIQDSGINAVTLASQISDLYASKANLASPTFTGTVSGITATMVGAPSGSGTSTGTNTGDQTSIVDITGTTAQFNTALTDNDFATLAGTEALANKTLTNPVIANYDGWISAGETWTYASASTFTVSGDVTAKYPKGTRLMFTQTTVKYGVVASNSYSAPNTTVTIIVNTDYTLANAAISANFYSYDINPQGYPGWFNWTPTLTGFSVNPTNTLYKFNAIGNRIQILYRQGTNGTSNLSTKTYTLPVACVTLTGYVVVAPTLFVDNGVQGSTPGMVTISNGATTASIFTTWASGTWTASGNCRSSHQAEYEF